MSVVGLVLLLLKSVRVRGLVEGRPIAGGERRAPEIKVVHHVCG